MSTQDAAIHLTLAGLARRCSDETERFFQHRDSDSRFCYELFRRAIAERNQQAWGLIYSQYRPLVLGWVRRHPALAGSGEEAEYFLNRTFEKMWSALGPEKFGQFPTLSALLRYLQLCVHSSILDYTHTAAHLAIVGAVDITTTETKVQPEPPREGANLDRERFWQELKASTHSDKEMLVLYESFVLGLKPRELLTEHPSTFRDIKEIYQLKENLLARLKRDSRLQERLREYV